MKRHEIDVGTRGEVGAPYVPPRPTREQLHEAARATAKRLAGSWDPSDATAVGTYETPGAVVVFGHPPQGYYAVVWDAGSYKGQAGETRVGVWDGLTIVHGPC